MNHGLYCNCEECVDFDLSLNTKEDNAEEIAERKVCAAEAKADAMRDDEIIATMTPAETHKMVKNLRWKQ